jgi:hypothetical protein
MAYPTRLKLDDVKNRIGARTIDHPANIQPGMFLSKTSTYTK